MENKKLVGSRRIVASSRLDVSSLVAIGIFQIDEVEANNSDIVVRNK